MIHRIISRLDIKGSNLVKGIHLEGLRVLGKPELLARYYYEEGADELMYQDVVASLYERNSLENFVEKTAEKIFIPLTVGGGIRKISDIKRILRAGADKVSINTAAINRPEFIKEAAEHFGASTIVVSMEVIRQGDGSYFLFTDNGREYTGIDVKKWVEKVQSFGAGEIFLTSVDREGTRKGLDTDLINTVSSEVSIPLICHGGFGNVGHIDFLKGTHIGGVAAASVFHYNYLASNKEDPSTFSEGNTDYLKSGIVKNNGLSIGEEQSCAIGIDITDKQSITKAIDEIKSRFGRIDALVSNAYPRNENYGRRFEDVAFSDFCENVSLHLGGYFLAAQQFASFFKEQGDGHIITMASVYGIIAPRFEIYENTEMTMPVEYAAIKSALIHLNKYMLHYFRGSGIRFNCLSPGGILEHQPQPFMEKYNSFAQSKGMLSPEDLTSTLLFLLSEKSKYLNGQNIVVDDGWSV